MQFLQRSLRVLKEDLCADCDLIVEAAFENMEVKKTYLCRA